MQVNLNTNINQSRPNFKASFSDDIETKQVLARFNNRLHEQINFLATHYALQDMTSDDKISLMHNISDDTIYAKNLTNGKEIDLSGYHAYYGNDVPARLRDAIKNGTLIDEKPKLDMDTYAERAVDFVYATTKKDDSIVSKLEQQIKILKDKLL